MNARLLRQNQDDYECSLFYQSITRPIVSQKSIQIATDYDY
jgi:hypothetical protein